MDREKLKEAADEYAHENAWYPGETSYESDITAMEESFSDTFKAGTDWLMQQPLSDRLTDEEKEGIKEIFKRANDSYVANDTLNTPRTPTEAHSRGYDVGVMSAIEDIFGKDLFNDNPETLK